MTANVLSGDRNLLNFENLRNSQGGATHFRFPSTQVFPDVLELVKY